jgi:hypothetical protein
MLAMARVVTPVRRTRASGVPLGAEVDPSYEKVCLLDVGLYAALVGLDAGSVIQNDLTLVHEGQIAEQLVGQEMRACRPFNQEPELYTWVREKKNSNAEVDYVIQNAGRVVPVEVKAGATGALRSVHMMVVEKRLESRGPGRLRAPPSERDHHRAPRGREAQVSPALGAALPRRRAAALDPRRKLSADAAHHPPASARSHSFFYGRAFSSLDDLRAQAARLPRLPRLGVIEESPDAPAGYSRTSVSSANSAGSTSPTTNFTTCDVSYGTQGPVHVSNSGPS